MGKSRLQDPFMREYAENFKLARSRLVEKIASSAPSDVAAVVDDEMRSLYHGLLVIFDGGTKLADKGLISVIDEDGMEFDRYLHELCFGFWPEEEGSGRGNQT